MAFNNPIFIKWNETAQTILNEQVLVTTNGTATLSQVPDSFQKVQIDGMFEVKQEKPITNENQFKVNYRNGYMTFHSNKIGQFITIKKYNGLGLIHYPASRIYDDTTGDYVDTANTLQDFINSIKPLGWQGEYDNNVLYLSGAIVYYTLEKTIYRCIIPTKGNLPTNTTYWQPWISVKEASDYATTQGDYAKSKGDYAKTQGDYAKIEGDYAKQQGDFANTATTNANNATNTFNNETIIIYKPYVTNYADIATTYPSPQNGWTTVATSTNTRYRYNSTLGQWINIDIAPYNTIGDLSALSTNDKSNLVNAIKENTSTLNDIVIDIRQFGAKCDGITDDTVALINALKSNYKNIKIPNAVMYISNGNGVVDSGVSKKLIGDNGATIKCDFLTSKGFLNLKINVEFENIIFDFNNKYMSYGLSFSQNVGTVKLKKLTFQNVRDMDTSTSSVCVNVADSILNADTLKFINFRKKPNGTIGDSGGNITGLYYTSQYGLEGYVQNVYVSEMHNIDDVDVVKFEDTSGIYVNSNVDTKKVFEIRNVTGNNYGKRLIKTQASNLNISNVRAHSDYDDVLVAIGIQDLSSEGDTSISIKNVIVSDFTITGKASIGVASSIDGVTFKNGYINVSGTNMTGNTAKSECVQLTGINQNLINVIGISEKSVLVDSHGLNSLKPYTAKNIDIKNCTFTITSTGTNGIHTGSSTTYGVDNLTIKDVKIVSNTNSITAIDIYNSNQGKNLTIDNLDLEFTGTDDSYTNGIYIRKISGVKTRNIKIKSSHLKGTYENIKLDDCDNVDVTEATLTSQDSTNSNRYVNLTRCNNVSVKSLKGGAYKWAVVLTNCNNVHLNDLDFAKISNNTSNGIVYLKGFTIGTTANRPQAPSIYDEHQDTTLGKPIWWNGTVWKDYMGNNV